MTGTITELRPGGFGFIASDAYGWPWALPFHRRHVEAAGDQAVGYDDIRVGH